MIDDNNTLPARVSPIAQLAPIPEEEIWLQKAEERADPAGVSARRAALHADTVDHDAGPLRQVDHKAVIA
jgi:hypothetical protein